MIRLHYTVRLAYVLSSCNVPKYKHLILYYLHEHFSTCKGGIWDCKKNKCSGRKRLPDIHLNYKFD